jgi:hypothetical protein
MSPENKIESCEITHLSGCRLEESPTRKEPEVMNKRRFISMLVAVMVVCGSHAMGQQSLKDMVTNEGFAWMAGNWKATTDEGQEIQLAYRWVAEGHAIVLDFKMGEVVSHGMIYFASNGGRVVSVSVDNKGNVSNGTWDIEGDKVVLKSKTTNANGETREMAVCWSKVDNKTMKVELYSIENGSLSNEPRGTLEFKRQTKQAPKSETKPAKDK